MDSLNRQVTIATLRGRLGLCYFLRGELTLRISSEKVTEREKDEIFKLWDLLGDNARDLGRAIDNLENPDPGSTTRQ